MGRTLGLKKNNKKQLHFPKRLPAAMAQQSPASEHGKMKMEARSH